MPTRSTDEVSTGQFPPHGRATFAIEGRLLISEAEGPFNVELVHALRGPVTEASRPLRAQGRPWGHLSCFRRSALASPETLAAFTALLTDMQREGSAPPYTAYVMGADVEGATLMTGPLRRCFETAGLSFAHFTTEDQARSWLASQLG